MNIKTIYILAIMLLLIIAQSCQSEEILERNEIPELATEENHYTTSSKSDSTSQEKEIEIKETDPPKDRDNWKVSN
ncbi:hypothetical protein [Chryseobacterium sp. Mn2064]|uniref:hypothetical protein n=1 Tax=Chryseobacterium sp. Mn2064 TaxID=3395263 RepID=UPI003BCEA9CE